MRATPKENLAFTYTMGEVSIIVLLKKRQVFDVEVNPYDANRYLVSKQFLKLNIAKDYFENNFKVI